MRKELCYAEEKYVHLGALWENREVRLETGADPPLYAMSFRKPLALGWEGYEFKQ